MDLQTFLRTAPPRELPPVDTPAGLVLRSVLHSRREIRVVLGALLGVFALLCLWRGAGAGIVEAALGTLCLGLCAGVALRVRSVQRAGLLRDGLLVRAMIVSVEGADGARKRIEVRYAYEHGSGSAVIDCSEAVYRAETAFGLGAEVSVLLFPDVPTGYAFPKGGTALPIRLI